jgi:uncharacterized surface anchored protein
MVWLVAGLFLLFACNGFAQSTTGMILGSVYDSSGASVAGVTVTITNVDQNVAVRTVTTDESGQFVAPQLPVGRYSVSAELKGFKKVVRTGLARF